MTSLSIILMDVILLVFLLMLSIPLPVCFAGALLFLSLFGDVSMKTMLIWVFSQSTGTVLLASPLFFANIALTVGFVLMFIYAVRDVYMAYRALFGQMKNKDEAREGGENL